MHVSGVFISYMFSENLFNINLLIPIKQVFSK
jgi:hypothetical protein